MSWWRRDGAIEIRFNRDEQRTRKPARRLQVEELGGERVLLARDADAGGTWLTLNAHGVCVALLNHYPADAVRTPPSGNRSRGRLVTDLAPTMTAAGVDAMTRTAPLSVYRPFHLLAWDLVEPAPLGLTWDGERAHALRLAPDFGMFTTSSYRSAEVESARHRRWGETVLTAPGEEAVDAFHGYEDPGDGAFGVTMQRGDAWTVSRSFLRATSEAAEYYLEARDPATGGFGPLQHVAVARAAADPLL